VKRKPRTQRNLELECLPEKVPDEPWIVYGQTLVPTGTAVDNPTPSENGALGEVASLPFVVPQGKKLTIEAYGVEAYADEAGMTGPDKGLVIVPWIGSELNADPLQANRQCLMSCYSSSQSNEILGARFTFPAGKVINVRIMCAENPAQVVGWYMRGALSSA
jgi:hypothetical protein